MCEGTTRLRTSRLRTTRIAYITSEQQTVLSDWCGGAEVAAPPAVEGQLRFKALAIVVFFR